MCHKAQAGMLLGGYRYETYTAETGTTTDTVIYEHTKQSYQARNLTD